MTGPGWNVLVEKKKRKTCLSENQFFFKISVPVVAAEFFFAERDWPQLGIWRHFLMVVEKEFNFTPKLGNSHIIFHQE